METAAENTTLAGALELAILRLPFACLPLSVASQ